MADSVTVSSLPDGFDLYAGYNDGRYKNVDQVKARFPTKTVLSIAVFPTDDVGDVLDVETGDATPEEAPAWIVRRRLDGHKGPLVYCSLALWATVGAQFDAQKVEQPGYWLAAYPGPGPQLIQGNGHQWIDRGGYDESVMPDYLPGIDPPPTVGKGILEDMTSYVNGSQEHNFWTNPATGICTHRWIDHSITDPAQPGHGWNKEYLPA